MPNFYLVSDGTPLKNPIELIKALRESFANIGMGLHEAKLITDSFRESGNFQSMDFFSDFSPASKAPLRQLGISVVVVEDEADSVVEALYKNLTNAVELRFEISVIESIVKLIKEAK